MTTNISLTTFEMDESNTIQNETLPLNMTYPWDDTSETYYDTTDDLKDDKIPGISNLMFLLTLF